jgi:HTH-type transcriptional repressor of NAD biosynthesis genes
LIETALSEMDEVLVIIYDSPDATDVPLNVRANWLRKLYPQVQVIEAWDGPTEVGDTPEIKKLHEDYILHTLKIRDVTHFYSSEFYGEHMSLALGAINRIVDKQRVAVLISGSAIRNHVFDYREYLHPTVYRDLITNVVFLGAPSTGKTTIAERLAKEFNTMWMPEYGREYWETHQIERRLTLEQLVEIAEGHLQREENLLTQANQYLFVDTNAITTYMFSMYYYNTALPRLVEVARNVATRYDVVFVCDTDIPYDDTWDRSGDANRQVFQKQIISDLLGRKIPYFTLRGTLDERVQYVQGILKRFRKYQNLLDLFGK